VALALVGALVGWTVGPLMRQGSAQEDIDDMLRGPDGTIVHEVEHNYDPRYQPVIAWLGEWERSGWVDPSRADAAPQPSLSAADFRDELRKGHVLYLKDATIDVAAPDWNELQGPLMRALGYADGASQLPALISRDSQGGLDVTYSYETVDDAGWPVVHHGRVIAVYQGERYPGSEIPPWTLVLVTVEGI